MNEIMNKPSWIEKESTYGPHPVISYFTGLQIKNKFYNQSLGFGNLRVDNIPDELKKNKWIPEDNKVYKCWWHWTNPADPADPGEDILNYIEELETETVKDLRSEFLEKISSKVNKLSLEKLKDLTRYIEKYY